MSCYKYDKTDNAFPEKKNIKFQEIFEYYDKDYSFITEGLKLTNSIHYADKYVSCCCAMHLRGHHRIESVHTILLHLTS